MDGKIGNEEVGSVKAKATNETPYGWLPCDGRSVLRTDYPELFNKFNTQTYDSDNTHTLLSRYGFADSTHFNLPDYSEVALVGIGTNGTDSIGTHDVYTFGEFKDDALKIHYHGAVNIAGYVSLGAIGDGTWSEYATYRVQLMGGGSNTIQLGSGVPAGDGSVTHGKQKGVNYLIKVL